MFMPDNWREVNKKVWKGEKSFLHATLQLYLINSAMKFHSDIPYGYQLYGGHKGSLKKKKQKKKN